tara:strand:+ start:789 stop:2180 length:1392 start_codon:yes stop_codon:yes gene_type:complete
MTGINKWVNHLTKNHVSIFPLLVFRIIFGIMMFFSTLRFALKGWIYDLYEVPSFFFTYYGFDWISPLPSPYMYVVFSILLISCIFITFGLFYKFNTIVFFSLFTYIELIDKTNYLNHYYFISLISLLLIFLPANRNFSLDTYFGICKRKNTVSAWQINIVKLQIGIVYFFAGISKLNYHWLIEAQPLINWLKHQSDFPIIGKLLLYDFTAYIFSWVGAIFDILIFFLLISRRWRVIGYCIAFVFHIMTAVMFPIGVFPYVMIASTLIFFNDNFHKKIIDFISKYSLLKKSQFNIEEQNYTSSNSNILKVFLIGFFTAQFFLPMRFIVYPGKLFWTEQGYRFSWRVMLIEKAGYSQFYIHEPKMDRKMLIQNRDYLTPQQEKMMSTQPDMILQYAHYLSDTFKDSTIIESNGEIIKMGDNPKITADITVSLFNKGSRKFIDPKQNLSKSKRGFTNKEWILDYEN